MNFDIEKLIGELKKSAPIIFIACLGLMLFGGTVQNDFPTGIKAAFDFARWLPFSLINGGGIGAVISLIVWATQKVAAFRGEQAKTRNKRLRTKTDADRVIDYVEHLGKIELSILLAMLRSRNGRAEQLEISDNIEHLFHYEIVHEETKLWKRQNAYSRIVALHPALIHHRKQVDKRVVEKLSVEHGVAFANNDELRRCIENTVQRDTYSSHKIMVIPTLT